jgi:predicted DNA-binding protein
MALERINLNVPPETRAELRALAKELQRTEAEVARQLLTSALERVKKERFYAEVAATMTPDLRDRMLGLAESLEALGG